MTGVLGTEVYCTANNDATLGGLLTVFHTERSLDSLTNIQNSLPVSLPPRRLHCIDRSCKYCLMIHAVSAPAERSGAEGSCSPAAFPS